ncbi:MAG: tRNA (guanosine(37)-N1)-methyltransferase TrmD, partial [Oscillospiraceae bacterium]
MTMRIDIATLFPEICEEYANMSIIGRAQKKEYITIKAHQIRDYTTNKQNQVDDYPYGGGHGMVMQAQPIYDCC